MALDTLIAIFGGLLLFIGILGGGFELKELRIPKIADAARILCSIVGIVFILVGIKMHPAPEPPTHPDTSAPHAPPRIDVVAGTYGRNCGAPYGNATGHLASKCNGRETCEYIIDYKVIGDAAPSCAKDYSADWKCGEGPDLRSAAAAAEAGFGTKITLSCR